MADDIAIRVANVSKTFRLPHEKNTSIKSAVVNFYHQKRTYETQQVLEDVSFEINKGEFFGIVGKNGSGKSTLLKMLAGIYWPTKGKIHINGKLTPFIELGVGFNPELTGRENVFLNGALLGFNRQEMESMYDDIVSFAELERFMDQKLKNYSSGMQVRLAFSIAIRAKSDILLIDEVLAVGDAAFQQKCYDVFAKLKKQGATIVLVTHDMSAVLRFCDKAAHIDQGKVKLIGKPKEVADSYLEQNFESRKGGDVNASKQDAGIVGVKIDQGSKIIPGAELTVVIDYENTTGKPIHFGFQIFNEAGTYCFGTNTQITGRKPVNSKKGQIKIHLKADLVPGAYTITAATMSENGTQVLDYRSAAASFRVINDSDVEGVALLSHKWES
jgi:ABC-2 type transport system ATP-binding protein